MYAFFSELLSYFTEYPWESLGIATLFVHIERGVALIRHILIPRFKLCRFLSKDIKGVREDCVKIYTFNQEISDNNSLKFILQENVNMSRPLYEIRQIIAPERVYLFSATLQEKIKEFSSKVDSQHEYILLHNKCPENLLAPDALETMVSDISAALPRTFWESTSAYFKNVDLKFKRPKPLGRQKFDSLFALGQAKNIEMHLMEKEIITEMSKDTILGFLISIKISYIEKNETSNT